SARPRSNRPGAHHRREHLDHADQVDRSLGADFGALARFAHPARQPPQLERGLVQQPPALRPVEPPSGGDGLVDQEVDVVVIPSVAGVTSWVIDPNTSLMLPTKKASSRICLKSRTSSRPWATRYRSTRRARANASWGVMRSWSAVNATAGPPGPSSGARRST